MEKYNDNYDFDFKSFDEIIKEVLGIVDLTDINSLKDQLKKSLIDLDNALTVKQKDLLSEREEKISALSKKVLEINSKVEKGELSKDETEELEATRDSILKDIENLQSKIDGLKSKLAIQKRKLSSEIDEITSEKNIDNILKKYIGIRYLSIQHLESRVLSTDSEDVKVAKNIENKNARLIFNLSRLVPSFEKLIVQRNELLKHIDTESRIIQFSKKEPKNTDRYDVFLPNKLEILFKSSPEEFPDKYGQMLENSGIYTYRFGVVKYSNMPNQSGQYIQGCAPKELVGVIKKDEFGQIQRYAVLMEQFSRDVPPEFYRDVLFSDMALRNSENNLGYLGEPEVDSTDKKYGYKLGFKGTSITDLLTAIYFEDLCNFVEVNCNYPLVRGVRESRMLMNSKMEQALDKLFASKQDKSWGEK